jgi:hypothetical protein
MGEQGPVVRLRLVKRGLLKDNSPRGIWEISEDGRRFLTSRGVLF